MKNHYELEYIHFMVNILEPFIYFKKNEGESDGGIIIMYKGKFEKDEKKVSEKEINIKQFIHFIQITFPIFIKEEIDILKEEIDEGKKQQDTFNIYNQLGMDGFKDRYKGKEDDKYYKKIIDSNEEELNNIKSFYQDVNGYSRLSKAMASKSSYLERLLNFNKLKHSKIEDVINLFMNIEYII